MEKNLIYIQSGGPTSVINTSLYGAIIEARNHKKEINNIYGSINGVEGLINNNIIDLNKEKEYTIELLKQTPGAALGSSRCKLPNDLNDKVYSKIISTLTKHQIKYVFVNGGNDSMDTCNKLSKLFKKNKLDIRVIGIPKTIDNDLVSTDHCIGYGSAAKYIINTVKQIIADACCYKLGKVYVIEIMGRNAGWLTASVDLLKKEYRPDYIYLPEQKFNLKEFLDNSMKTYKKKGYCINVISEGIKFNSGDNKRKDKFNHIQLGGVSYRLASIIEKELNLSTRAIELSLCQRANPILISKVDSDEAIGCSKFAILQAIKGETGKMVSINRISDNPYKISFELIDLNKIANKEKMIPSFMMNNHQKMSIKFQNYLKPLIQKELNIKYKNGVIELAKLEKKRI